MSRVQPIAARDLVDFVHLLFHLPKENGIRHGLPYVVHAAHQVGTGFGCDAPHFHGQRYGQEFNDDIVFGQQIAQGLILIGVHRQRPDAARFIIRFSAFVTCAAIGHGDMGKRIVRQYIVQSPLPCNPMPKINKFLEDILLLPLKARFSAHVAALPPA